MHLGHWQVVTSYGSRLFINTQNKTLWRYGWGRAGQGVRHNFTWLQQVHDIIPTPVPLSCRTIGPLTVTSESYVPGRPLTPAEITPEQVRRILAALAPLHATGRIHGDLTHRNILSGSEGLYFIDGDRSGSAPPEFDAWLLVADAAIHRTGRASHREFLRSLWRTSPYDEPYQSVIRSLYTRVPALAGNEGHWPQLWASFLARCLAHSVRDCVRRGKSLDFLDGL